MDFDDVRRVVSDTANKAVKKSGELIEYTKISYAIYDAQNDISKLFTEIGQIFYEGYKSDEMSSEAITQKCELIDAKNKEIELLKEKRGMLKNIKSCSKCNKDNLKTNDYCSSCGAKLED